MIIRIIMTLALMILGAGFIFFAANVIWLGTKEFFTKYGPSSKTSSKKNKKSRKEKTDEHYNDLNLKEKING